MKYKWLFVLSLAELVTPAHASSLTDLIAKWLSAPNYVYLPNLLDNQPTPTDTCDVSNRRHTEQADGNSIGVRQYGCIINNVNVVFTVSIPKACETVRCGLIVDQHGGSMNAQQQNAGTRLREYGWQAMQIGAPTPYIVVQPNMTDLLDEVTGQLDVGSVMGGPYVRELPVLLTFVQNVIRALNVDLHRVHFHGFSWGGDTANLIYCDARMRMMFASYAVSGAALNCTIDRPYMQVNGLTDPSFSAAEQVVTRFEQDGAQALSIEQNPNWQTPYLRWPEGKLTLIGKLKHMRVSKGSLKLENIQHSGAALPLAGHCLPKQGPAAWLVCPATFDIGRKVLEFFMQNPAP